MRAYKRPYEEYVRPGKFGKITWVEKQACTCDSPRGPKGGVCGNCGGAILADGEKA